ncbi:SDR family oxidoreductase [Nocardia sp. NBC_00565]|uniref:SDR family oxidoreductase n=1 Tax=Nocardia sp. NBC_00565 TaxID=2975993 RepID=UPI002E80F52B|nr:SDR family oxidoreductase [Nocardia sp. NBC_00565]WUC03403.1 SDR family oxidoreductase [Nocardia sp. NBC_00565]
MTTVGVVTGAGRGMGLACARELVGQVDTVLMVDRDPETVTAAAAELSAGGGVVAEPFVLDVTDDDGLARLAKRVAELGTLRSIAHAAGVSPTMADWRRIFTVDLVATARLAETLRPLAVEGTAMVVFASMSPMVYPKTPDVAALAVLDDPLHEEFLDHIRAAVGPDIEDTGMAYTLAKLGVHRFVWQEAVRLGPAGARICSVSPGVIDTPQGEQEAEAHPIMARLVEQTPLRRKGHAEEVATVVAFALSDRAGFLNGIDLLVDGGCYAALRTQTGR